MAVTLILKNSGIEDKRPNNQLTKGEIGLNSHESGAFICVEDTAGNLQQIGGIKISEDAPGQPVKGTAWIQPSTNNFYVYDGGKWLTSSGGSGGGGGGGAVDQILGGDGIDVSPITGVGTVTVTNDIDPARGVGFQAGQLGAKLGAGLQFNASGEIESTGGSAMTYRGTVDLTSSTAKPSTPDTGDTYANDGPSGASDAVWNPDIPTGTAVNPGDLVIWNGTQWTYIPTGSASEPSFWKRTGGDTVEPINAGDDVSTTGDLFAANATLTADLSAVNSTLSGDLSAVNGTFSGDVSGVDGSFSGNVSGVDGTFSGDVSSVNGTFSGNVSAVDGTFSGDISAVNGTLSGDFNSTGDIYTGTVKPDVGVDVAASKLGADGTVIGSVESGNLNNPVFRGIGGGASTFTVSGEGSLYTASSITSDLQVVCGGEPAYGDNVGSAIYANGGVFTTGDDDVTPMFRAYKKGDDPFDGPRFEVDCGGSLKLGGVIPSDPNVVLNGVDGTAGFKGNVSTELGLYAYENNIILDATSNKFQYFDVAAGSYDNMTNPGNNNFIFQRDGQTFSGGVVKIVSQNDRVGGANETALIKGYAGTDVTAAPGEVFKVDTAGTVTCNQLDITNNGASITAQIFGSGGFYGNNYSTAVPGGSDGSSVAFIASVGSDSHVLIRHGGDARFDGTVQTGGGTVSPAFVLQLETDNPANYEIGEEQIQEYVGPTMNIGDTLVSVLTALENLKTSAASATTVEELRTAIETALADV